MLGNCLVKFLSRQRKNDEIITLDRCFRWPNQDFIDATRETHFDFVINCIGSIPQKKKDFSINLDLPVFLNESLPKGTFLINPGTDCEIDKDPYGISKKAATDYLISSREKIRILKTSIVGHELSGHVSLLDWFLKQNGDVKGYKNHFWNGITTLEWSKNCNNVIDDFENYQKLTHLGTDCISKFDLLTYFKEVYNRSNFIEAVDHHEVKDKCLRIDIKTKPIKDQLIDLRDFYERKH